jgi:hypothetical protein
VTDYYILQREADLDAWHMIETGILHAPSAEAALRMALKDEPTAGTYVAIPARSWKPITVTAETQVVIRLTNNDTTEPTTDPEEEALA